MGAAITVLAFLGLGCALALLGYRYLSDLWAAKRNLDLFTGTLSEADICNLFVRAVARKRDAWDWSGDELQIQPPSMVWTLGLRCVVREDGVVTARVRPVRVHFEPWPSQRFPVTQVVRNGDDIGARLRSFIAYLRDEDPNIDIHRPRAVFEMV